MALFNWFSFSDPLIFWLLRVFPGPVSSVADLLASLRNHKQMLSINEAIRCLTERHDQLDIRFCTAILQTQQAIQRILAADSVVGVDSQLGCITKCHNDGVHTLLSPDIVRNPSLREAFLRNPEQFGSVSKPTDDFKPNGLQIIGGDKEPILVSPSASALFELIDNRCGTRRNLDSVSQPEWFEFIRQRKLRGTVW
jgi:hypothetical protein